VSVDGTVEGSNRYQSTSIPDGDQGSGKVGGIVELKLPDTANVTPSRSVRALRRLVLPRKKVSL